MKDTFRGYEILSDGQLKAVWATAVFVVDSNVLLNLYAYTLATRDKILAVLRRRADEDRLWLPHQAALEFHRNRVNRLIGYIVLYTSRLQTMRERKEEFQREFGSSIHPFVTDELFEELQSVTDRMISDLEQRAQACRSLVTEDPVRDAVHGIYAGRVGEPYDDKRRSEILAEGKCRFADRTPPGYGDDGKPDDRKFGDLVLWFQVIDKAKKAQKPIILVTDDLKGDWWKTLGKEVICPRPELGQEMWEKAGVQFLLLTTNQLQTHAKDLGDEMDDQAISEVRQVGEQQVRFLDDAEQTAERISSMSGLGSGREQAIRVLAQMDRVYGVGRAQEQLARSLEWMDRAYGVGRAQEQLARSLEWMNGVSGFGRAQEQLVRNLERMDGVYGFGRAQEQLIRGLEPMGRAYGPIGASGRVGGAPELAARASESGEPWLGGASPDTPDDGEPTVEHQDG